MKNAYVAMSDTVTDMSWQEWLVETQSDDNRRYNQLKSACTGKSILEFGCGNGGFLRKIGNVATNVTGIELMDEARDNLKSEGIETYKALDEVDEVYDVICMFNVIEH